MTKLDLMPNNPINNDQYLLIGTHWITKIMEFKENLSKSAEGLVFPTTIKGSLDLSNLTSAEGLTLPTTISGYLNLSGLTSANGLVLPTTIGGNLYLSGLTSAEGLVLPTTIGGNLDLHRLTSADGLVFPTTINGNLDLHRLTSADGLVFPTTIDGSLDLSNLTSTDGLVLPTTVNGYLSLSSLTSAEGLVLPTTIDGNLYLLKLTSAEGLVLPTTIDGDLYLYDLTSADGLELSKTITIGGSLYLNCKLSQECVDKLINKFNNEFTNDNIIKWQKLGLMPNNPINKDQYLLWKCVRKTNNPSEYIGNLSFKYHIGQSEFVYKGMACSGPVGAIKGYCLDENDILVMGIWCNNPISVADKDGVWYAMDIVPCSVYSVKLMDNDEYEFKLIEGVDVITFIE